MILKKRLFYSQMVPNTFWPVINTRLSIFPSCRTLPVWRCHCLAPPMSWWSRLWKSGWPPTDLRTRYGGVSIYWGSANVWNSLVETIHWFNTRSVAAYQSCVWVADELQLPCLTFRFMHRYSRYSLLKMLLLLYSNTNRETTATEGQKGSRSVITVTATHQSLFSDRKERCLQVQLVWGYTRTISIKLVSKKYFQ